MGDHLPVTTSRKVTNQWCMIRMTSIQVFENVYIKKQEKNPKLVVNQQHRYLVVSSKHHFYDF